MSYSNVICETTLLVRRIKKNLEELADLEEKSDDISQIVKHIQKDIKILMKDVTQKESNINEELLLEIVIEQKRISSAIEDLNKMKELFNNEK